MPFVLLAGLRAHLESPSIVKPMYYYTELSGIVYRQPISPNSVISVADTPINRERNLANAQGTDVLFTSLLAILEKKPFSMTLAMFVVWW